MNSTETKETRLHNFLDLNATKRLKELAENPVDLTLPETITQERIQSYVSEACGYKFLYATERIDSLTLDTLRDLASESKAIEKMHQQQSGEVVSYIIGHECDNRAVLHTANRDFFGNPRTEATAQEAAKLSKNEIEKLKRFIESIEKSEQFTTMIVIGIGGSNLGPQAHYLALEKNKPKTKHVFFVDNVDPDTACKVVAEVDLKKTLVLSISKSGTTLETVSNDNFIRQQYISAGLQPRDHFISVTTPGTPMDDSHLYFETFYIWDWVGGRFSTSSMGGGVLLSFAYGVDAYMEFLRGANAMDKVALENDLSTNLPLLGALIGIWNRNFLNYPALAVIPYSDALKRYAAHIQQVDMESNGKCIDRFGKSVHFETGPMVWGEPGTSAQHSFYQLIHQGTNHIALEIIGLKEGQYSQDILWDHTYGQEKLNAFMFAQMLSLAQGQKSDNPNKLFPGNRPSHLLLTEKVTPFSLGALLAYYEHKIAFQGYIWNINSFDQEGVQLGKDVANKILQNVKNIHSGFDCNTQLFPLGDAFWKHL
ncbi:MAG: glucose-6-phosphate isomerase [Chlamydiota bacterium]|nr:glucose-6-phosphate isomerase [Chlamydiota bacterium]